MCPWFYFSFYEACGSVMKSWKTCNPTIQGWRSGPKSGEGGGGGGWGRDECGGGGRCV